MKVSPPVNGNKLQNVRPKYNRIKKVESSTFTASECALRSILLVCDIQIVLFEKFLDFKQNVIWLPNQNQSGIIRPADWKR